MKRKSVPIGNYGTDTSLISSQVPIPAALNRWRCKNLPNSGNPKLHNISDMAVLGDVRKASELGYDITQGHDMLYVYSMCTNCSRSRWVRCQDIKSGKGLLCRSCSHTTTKSFRNHIERVVESGAKRASELGKPVFKNRDPWYYPQLCSICGEQIWHQRKDLSRVCKKCTYKARQTLRGINHPNWNGGQYKQSDGYIVVQLQPDNRKEFHSISL